MSLPRYPEYKDSGVEWLGEVPSHWAVTRFKWLIDRNDGGVWGGDPDGVEDTLVLRSTEQTVDGRWKIEDPAFRKLTGRDRDSALLEVGDLLVTKSSGSALHIGKTTIVDASVAALRPCYSNFMQRVRVSRRLHPRLAWYLLNSDLSRLQLGLLSNSTTGLANLNGTIVGELLLAVQTRAEQEQILAFLDRETATIDALIAEQETLLALLAEKRQATISHAVTRGLDPNVPMKDSGIAWLGEVPAHWELTTLGKTSMERCDGPFGSGIKSDHYTEEGALVVRLQNIRAGEFNMGEPVFLDLKYFEESLKGHEVRAGDLLVAGLGDDNNLLGRACVAPEGMGPALVKADCFRFRLHPEKALSTFVAMQLSAGAAFDAGQMATGTTRARMPLGVMASRKLVMPPVQEQTQIVAIANDAALKFDALGKEAKRGVELLKERRSALISAAVTGHIDIRDTSNA